MRVAIVEDEKLSQDIIIRFLKKIDDTIEIAIVLDSVRESIKWFSENEVDLIFMDIHLTDGNCFLIFDEVIINTPIIFTTSYDTYSIKAFDVNSVSYIMKPITEVKLNKAITKLQTFGFVKENKDKQFKTRFSIKLGIKIIIVEINNISYFYNENKDCYLITKDGNKYIINYTISQLEEVLDPKTFFRMSRACIGRIESIGNIQKIANNRLVVNLNPFLFDPIIVSQNRVEEFNNWLNA